MKGYNFTDRLKKALAMARAETARMQHEYVGTEHLLLGLIREGEGDGMAVLKALHIDPREVRRRLEAVLEKRRASTRPDLPYTSRARKVLDLAMNEARTLGHSYLGTHHLLAGLVREEKGIAAQVLRGLGAELDAVRRETSELLSASSEGEKEGRSAETPRGLASPRIGQISFTVQVEDERGVLVSARFDHAATAIKYIRMLDPGRPRRERLPDDPT